MSLRKLIYLEYFIGFIISFILYMHLDFSFIVFLILLFVPDITICGYFLNAKIGAFLYNVGHSLILPFMLFIVAFLNDWSNVLMITIIWIAHILLDRSVGFGLKYEQSFKETHVQKID